MAGRHRRRRRALAADGHLPRTRHRRALAEPPAAAGALARLLGGTRATILASLDAPTSTTDLAARLGLSPAGVSRHLVVLRDAGLLTATRHGHEVRYGRTRLAAPSRARRIGWPRLGGMSAIAELAADQVVEGGLRGRPQTAAADAAGSPYLALELVDPSGRIEARVWNDVELLDARFGEGDAVRVLGRVERFRDRLQLDVRSIEAAPATDPAALAPAMRRDGDELQGFLEFLCDEIAHEGLRETARRVLADCDLRAFPATPDGHHSYAGGLLEHTVGVATLCRETAQLHPRLRSTCCSRPRSSTTPAGRASCCAGRRSRRPTRAGCSGTCTSGCASSRSAPAGSTRPRGQSFCTPSARTTTRARRGPRRRPCSTTRTCSTPSRPPGRSAE